MSTDELQDTASDTGDEELEPLKLDVKVESPSACQRHITVTIPREDIDRYYDRAYSEMMESAAVPGFRSGRAPRKLVESRYRTEVTEQIKGSLLMDSMAQVNDEQSLAAISEPDFDVEAIEVPDEGPMSFEFDLEVRPDFDVPQWKGLKIERPTAEYGKDEIDQHVRDMLEQFSRQVPKDGPAEAGDFVTFNLTVKDGDNVIRESSEQTACIRPKLSFHDGVLDKFDKLMKGAKTGDTLDAKLKLSAEAANEELAGKQVALSFEVLDVKQVELPELTPDLLKEFGDFESEAELRDAVKDSAERRLEYEQQQRARQQVTQLLTEAAKWELPPELLKRQSEREVERSLLELRRAGFPEDAIQAHANELRQNSQRETARALREHFILERIAEEESIDAVEADYDREISLIAMQSGSSPRRVRAQIDKGGLMDSLRNQIVERKVIELVLEHAKFKDVLHKPEGSDVAAIDIAAGGGEESEMPVAKHAEAEELSEPKDRS